MTPTVLYWDSNCFLAWLQEEPHGFESCEDVLKSAEHGRCRIITSTLTISEVLNIRGSKPIHRVDRDRVVNFFKREYIFTSPLTQRIAEHSRDLVWDFGIHPKDAVHVATALAARVPILNTFDKKLIAKSGKIGDYSMQIERPSADQYNLL